MSDLPELVDVVRFEIVDEQSVHLWFSDGKDGVVNLMTILHGPAFEDIIQTGELMGFELSKGEGTLTWRDGTIDVAPETLWMKAAHIPRDF